MLHVYQINLVSTSESNCAERSACDIIFAKDSQEEVVLID